jgi:hypothetical protein
MAKNKTNTRSSSKATKAKAPAKPTSVEEFKKMSKAQMAEYYAQMLSQLDGNKAAGAVCALLRCSMTGLSASSLIALYMILETRGQLSCHSSKISRNSGSGDREHASLCRKLF